MFPVIQARQVVLCWLRVRKLMPHILIVDEQAEICCLLERMLRRSGYTAHAVAAIAEVNACARLQKPDLVLLDFVQWRTPVHEMVLRLSQKLPDATTPLVVMSTTALHDVENLAGVNVVDFLHKPFLMSSLLTAVERGLKIGWGWALAR